MTKTKPSTRAGGKKLSQQNNRLYRSHLRCGWLLVVEGGILEEGPMVFSDEWVMKINPEQREMFYKAVKDFEYNP